MNKKFYDGISNYAQLNHGLNFCNQGLHWQLHQCDSGREISGINSIEYQTLIKQLAGELATLQRGSNFTLEELMHYDREHTRSMADAKRFMELSGQIPFTNYQTGYNFVNVMADKGNADGDFFKVSTYSSVPRVTSPKLKTPEAPSAYDKPSKGEPTWLQPNAMRYQTLGDIIKKKR